jgi:RNA polymerase-binding transcription factor DksA
MEEKICKEFVVGFCPFEEFAVESLTLKCSLKHDEDRRKEYMLCKNFHPYDLDALNTYRAIINDIDKKIAHNKIILAEVMDQKDIINALEYTEQLIEQKATSLSDTDALYSLLKIHGALLDKAEETLKQKSYTVCENCGVFKKESSCIHQFCKKYEKIRIMIKSLEIKSK